ncbi:Phosphoribosylamine--glycine ligase (EC [Olavius sp. associated proteobacterium Delta 1]|nr:Phosphoribosylamine--glycine ligase (EC [Olavius sp. associated proteobacterium Delta 1]
MKKIAFAGTDGRTLLSALVTATAKSDIYPETFTGVVIRGTPSMPVFCEIMNWPVEFVETASNSVADYTAAIITALKEEKIDYVIPMPEALLFDGLVDAVEQAGFGDRIVGLTRSGAFIEGDKIECKKLCRDAGIPVAASWCEVDAKDYQRILATCLNYIDAYGGAVLKYPYSAGGKGARIILNSWEIREVYDALIKDYKDSYKKIYGGKGKWPLLIESLMSGVEISFTILVDRNGHFQILPTAMDYPERFEGPTGKSNPITGGMGAVSPHPLETPHMIEMAGGRIAKPLIEMMKTRGILRPCVLYPGCFVSLSDDRCPTAIRVSEINIRPGEPEAQPVIRRLRNLAALIQATLQGNLDEVEPEVRTDQLAMCSALVTGPGGPDGQKGYPWSCTRGEVVEIDFKYMKRKGIQVIPSAMMGPSEDGSFKSDGTRVAYLNANVTVKPTENRGEVAERFRNKLLAAFDNGKIRVIPREDLNGNRLDLRRDIGFHYLAAEKIFPD